MKIKVPLHAEKIRRQYAAVVAVLSAISSFYFISVQVSDGQRKTYVVSATLVLVLIYLAIWMRANLKQKAKLHINNSSVVIKIGDIFDQKGLKAIAFNEYFDTLADDVLISKSSLNGIYLQKLGQAEVSALDEAITSDVRMSERIVETVSGRSLGKNIKYKLGSVYLHGEYMLTAFSHFDDQNRAYLTLKEYVSCMLNFWDEVDQLYAGRSVSVPLMGSGITRFRDAEVQPQELLKILIWSYKISRVKFKHPANATIVVHSSMSDKINLYDLDA